MTEVAVLGCGPAGLLVAHAVQRAGHEPVILSRKEKSFIPGSQHLQGFIPDITPEYPDSAVLMLRLGTAEDYAKKVYDDVTRNTGWPNYNGVFKSWSVYKAYDKLWDMFERSVHDTNIDGDVVATLAHNYPLVFSTLPAPPLCSAEHEFESIPYWIRTLGTPDIDLSREVVVFNGLPHDEWYRWSILGGKTSIEGVGTAPDDPPGAAYIVGRKAINNNCTCYAKFKNFHRLGRWAQWRHGVLLHHAFAEAQVAMTTKIGVRVG